MMTFTVEPKILLSIYDYWCNYVMRFFAYYLRFQRHELFYLLVESSFGTLSPFPLPFPASTTKNLLTPLTKKRVNIILYTQNLSTSSTSAVAFRERKNAKLVASLKIRKIAGTDQLPSRK